MYCNDSNDRNSKLRETPKAEFNFLENQNSLVELIKPVHTKLKTNQYLGVLSTGIPTE